MATKARKAKAPKGDPTHLIQAFSLRMPPALRSAMESELEGFNRTREVGSKPRTLNDEIVTRLFGTLGPDAQLDVNGGLVWKRARKRGGK